MEVDELERAFEKYKFINNNGYRRLAIKTSSSIGMVRVGGRLKRKPILVSRKCIDSINLNPKSIYLAVI